MSKYKDIQFDPEKMKRLEKAYEKAVSDGDKSFIFEGDEFVTGYAKYVIEYLHMVFKEN